jgi:hypothetical protein
VPGRAVSSNDGMTRDGESSSCKLPGNITPGEILAEEFLVPMGITEYRLARHLGFSADE